MGAYHEHTTGRISMRTSVVLHAIVLVCLGLSLLAANCEGTGLTEDCKPGELGCACGNFPECPKDDKNRPTLCCPDPLLCCGDGNICRSIPHSSCQGDDGSGDDGSGDSGTGDGGTGDDGTGDGGTSDTAGTSATGTPTPTGTASTGS
jgi:hypothetical protein